MPASSDDGAVVTQTVVLPADVALHARPAAEVVRAAAALAAPVTIAANGKQANAKSILAVLTLGATGGTTLTLSASGPAAAESVAALAGVIAGLRE
ncbi:MAG: HPr family phosphocarrier protein [Chloroflexi bacterium]|nr:HPr family phosphocarrier protein [Chloroflexota bacterium]